MTDVMKRIEELRRLEREAVYLREMLDLYPLFPVLLELVEALIRERGLSFDRTESSPSPAQRMERAIVYAEARYAANQALKRFAEGV